MYQGQIRAFRLTPVLPSSITLSATSVLGGIQVTGTVTLSGPAPMEMDVPLFSRNNRLLPGHPGVHYLPPAIHFASGQSVATFEISTYPAADFMDTIITLSVAGEGMVHSAMLNIRRPGLSSLIVGPNPITGHASEIWYEGDAGASVSLDGDIPSGVRLVVTFGLNQTNPVCQIENMPLHIELVGGGWLDLNPAVLFDQYDRTNSIRINTTQVTNPVDVTVLAEEAYILYGIPGAASEAVRIYGGRSFQQILRVLPPAIERLNCAGSINDKIPGGRSVRMDIELNVPLGTNDASVSLTSSSPVATLPSPATLLMLGGRQNASFTMDLATVEQATLVTITATLYDQPFSKTITVQPIGPKGLWFNVPETVGGTGPITGTVWLNAPAEAGGALVAVASDNPAAIPPAQVLAPEGQTMADFSMPTLAVTSTTPVQIIASRHDQFATNTLTILPIGPARLTFNRTNVIGGKRVVTGTVHLNAPAEAGGANVALAANNPVVTIPGQVLIPAGSTSTDFPIQTVRVDSDTPVAIAATRFDRVASNTLQVVPVPTIVLAGLVNVAADDQTTIEDMNIVVGTNATLTVAGQHRLESLTVQGTVTHPRGETNGVNLVLEAALTVAAGGKIDVTGKGYRGANRDGNNSAIGETWSSDGLGTTTGGSTVHAGGSYGGLGSVAQGGVPNALYGATNGPAELGSGGAGQSGIGGNGGGRVYIQASNMVVNGQILANGADAGYHGGGGSGGAIWLQVAGGIFGGSGSIKANGGAADGGYSAAGGGGRIAVVGYLTTNFTGPVTAGNGTIYWGRDTDGDGLPDDYELAHNMDPNLAGDANQDSDGDGLTNVQEFRAGTDPRNATSVFKVVAPQATETQFQFGIATVSGKRYRVEWCDDLATGNWQVLVDNLPGTGGAVSLTDTGIAGQPGRYYRVLLIP
jgi:hypothetical protein